MPPTFRPALVTDTQRQVTVLFGGTNGATASNETWEWDGADWTQRNLPNSPPARAADMAYDESRGEMVLFGGVPHGLGGVYMGDTWIYDGVDWTEAMPATSPPIRAACEIAYDRVRERVVMFGGYGVSGELNDTWEWDGTNWTEVVTATQPPTRHGHSMVYDPIREEVVLFSGGRNAGYVNDMWRYDGQDWTSIPLTGVVPGPRSWTAMTWVPSIGKIVIAGGWVGSMLDDTWLWDGSSWEQVNDMPEARHGHSFAVDPVRPVVLAMCGRPCRVCSPVNSQLELAFPVAVGTFTSYGQACSVPGFAEPVLSMPAVARIGSTATVQVDNCLPNSFGFVVIAAEPLAQPSHFPGTPSGCLAYVDPLVDMKVLLWGTDGNGSMQVPITVPGQSNLIGVSLQLQGVAPIFDTSIAPLPFLTSNAGTATVGS